LGSALFDQEAVNLEDDKKNGVAASNMMSRGALNDVHNDFEEMMRAQHQPKNDIMLDEFEQMLAGN